MGESHSHVYFRFRNYSGLNQYFPRNALFLPSSGGRNSAFRVGKMDGLSSYQISDFVTPQA